MVRFFAICFLLIIIAESVVAQSACELTLTKAQEEFDAGRFHGVPSMLRECLDQNQNREWEQRAYLLLAETYLLLEDPIKADESYLKVLQANPEFLADESRDPIDLVYLSRKFTATPIFSLTARVGLNTSFIRVIHDVRISDQDPAFPKDSEEDYSPNVGWQAGLGLEFHYKPTISLSAEAVYEFTSFTHSGKNMFKEGNYRLDFTDRQSWITIPLMVRYTHGTKPLRPFAAIGYAPGLLLRDRADMVIDGDTESEVFDYKYKRATFNSSVVAAMGLKYKWGLRYIYGEVRYSLGLSNLANPETRWDHFGGINQDWPYVDDDFRMDNLYVSIGYVHPFYKARKLKNARTKSVLRKTKKADGTNN